MSRRIFFTEWYDQLLEINPSDRDNLEISCRRYIYHRSRGHLTENSRTQEDTDWIDIDLSGLDNYEPYTIFVEIILFERLSLPDL